MKKLVLEITSHSGDGSVTHRMVESFPATLGRGYHNDIILSDPHISAQHLRIEYDGEGWSVSDLGSDNGITVNGRVYRNTPARLTSGDTVHVGRTEIRAYDPLHPVPKERRLQRAHPFLSFLSRPVTVWGSFVLALVSAIGWSYLEAWNPEPGPQLATSGAAVLAFILVWSALWAVAGRLIRHKSRFRSHVALISLVITLSFTVVAYLKAYADFLTNENWIAGIITQGLSLAMLVGLLYGCLSLATDMPERRRFGAAAFFSVGLLVGLYALSQISERNFRQHPEFPSALKPYLAHMAPADSAEDFMTGSAKLFESRALSVKSDK
jgi:hypothetical protein